MAESRDLERLQEAYREARLLLLKYDNLAEVCRSLLKPWPNYDSSGTAQRGEKVQPAVTPVENINGRPVLEESVIPAAAENESLTEDSHTNSQQADVADMKLLEDILSKAHKIRTEQLEVDSHKSTTSSKAKSAAARTTEMAADIYGQPSAGRKTHTQSSRTTQKQASGSGKRTPFTAVSSSSTKRLPRQASKPLKPKPGSGPREAASLGREKGGARNKSRLTASGSSSSPTAKSVAHSQRRVREWSPVVTSRATDKPLTGTASDSSHSQTTRPTTVVDVDTQSSLEARHLPPVLHHPHAQSRACFSIESDGFKLSMPQKYRKLHEALLQLSEHFRNSGNYDSCETTAARLFCRRLTASGEIQSKATKTRLSLMAEELGLLRDMILSISPQEWTVTDRSSVEDIYKIKSKIDHIKERFEALDHVLGRESKTAPSLPLQPPANLFLTQPSLPPSPPHPLAHSSLSDWQTAALGKHQERLLSAEQEIAAYCKDVLLPLADHLPSNTSVYLEVVQLLHRLLGQATKPKFIAVEQNC